MGLEPPNLDERTFEELVADARKRIPVHSDAWTDHNAHDPGITILEVLAHVAESDLYRLDQITDEHVEKYLSLLGAAPRPPEPATARLELAPPPALVGQAVPAGTRIGAEDVDGVERTFETTTPVVLTDATVGAVVSDRPGGRADATTANRTGGMAYSAFGERARRGSSLYVGFEGDPFAGGILDLGVDFDETGLPAPASHGGEEPTFEPSASVAWEFCTDYGAWYRDAAWEELSVVRDETDHLYGGGIVRIERPAGWQSDPAAILDRPRELRWLRCTVREPGHEVAPRFEEVYTNPVRASHRTTRTDEPLSTPDGDTETTAQPGQTFAFPHQPVLDATVTVGGEPWEAVDSLDASSPDDGHFVLDEAAGTVRFGDEIRGRIPAPDQRVVAEEYVHGGGAGGNVSAAADWQFHADRFAGIDVELRGAGGGRDAETTDAALARLQRDRETPHRAVTAADYEYVATHTPGLRFGRAAAVVEEVDRGGAGECEPAKRVRVVVVPYSTRARPEPSDGFLDAVRCHVERHRLLTDRVTVEAPTYVGVGVDVEVGLESGYAAAGRSDAVGARLDEFLDPLAGFDGDGWPFGRAVYLSEVYEAVDGVEGVDCVFDVSLSPTGGGDVDGEGNVVVGGTVLAYPTDHTVSVREEYGSCGGEP
jgi:predicted phage baseplate assembly protein